MKKLFFCLSFVLSYLFADSVYVSDNSGNVIVIDSNTNLIVATIPTGANPVGITITPDGNTAYVALSTSPTVAIINTVTNAVTGFIGVGTSPQYLAASPNNQRVYVANTGSDNVSVIDTATNSVIATITVGDNPIGVVVSPNAATVYVVNDVTVGNDTVSVIDTATNSVIATITVGMGPFLDNISPSGQTLYVVNNGENNVSVINTATNTVIATIPVGLGPFDAAFFPSGTTAYVSNDGGPPNDISIIDTASSSVIGTIDAGARAPEHIAISANGNTAYVTTAGTVLVINTATNTITAVITVPGSQDIAINPPSFVPSAPSNGFGKQVLHRFPTQGDLINQLFWTASPFNATSYHIYRDSLSNRIAIVTGTSFEDHQRIQGQTVTYFVKSVDMFGFEGGELTITVQPIKVPIFD